MLASIPTYRNAADVVPKVAKIAKFSSFGTREAEENAGGL